MTRLCHFLLDSHLGVSFAYREGQGVVRRATPCAERRRSEAEVGPCFDQHVLVFCFCFCFTGVPLVITRRPFPAPRRHPLGIMKKGTDDGDEKTTKKINHRGDRRIFASGHTCTCSQQGVVDNHDVSERTGAVAKFTSNQDIFPVGKPPSSGDNENDDKQRSPKMAGTRSSTGIGVVTQGRTAIMYETSAPTRSSERGSYGDDLLPRTSPNAAGHDPSAWLEGIRASVVEDLKQASASPDDSASFSVSGQQHGTEASDASGAVVRQIFGYLANIGSILDKHPNCGATQHRHRTPRSWERRSAKACRRASPPPRCRG